MHKVALRTHIICVHACVHATCVRACVRTCVRTCVRAGQVKRALEKLVSKDAKQEAKRLEAQAVTFWQCGTLLHFIQMLCEGHNGRIQDYLRVQDDRAAGRKAKKKINLVSEVVHFFREVTESMPERLSFVPAYYAAAVEARTHACMHACMHASVWWMHAHAHT